MRYTLIGLLVILFSGCATTHYHTSSHYYQTSIDDIDRPIPNNTVYATSYDYSSSYGGSVGVSYSYYDDWYPSYISYRYPSYLNVFYYDYFYKPHYYVTYRHYPTYHYYPHYYSYLKPYHHHYRGHHYRRGHKPERYDHHDRRRTGRTARHELNRITGRHHHQATKKPQYRSSRGKGPSTRLKTNNDHQQHYQKPRAAKTVSINNIKNQRQEVRHHNSQRYNPVRSSTINRSRPVRTVNYQPYDNVKPIVHKPVLRKMNHNQQVNRQISRPHRVSQVNNRDYQPKQIVKPVAHKPQQKEKKVVVAPKEQPQQQRQPQQTQKPRGGYTNTQVKRGYNARRR